MVAILIYFDAAILPLIFVSSIIFVRFGSLSLNNFDSYKKVQIWIKKKRNKIGKSIIETFVVRVQLHSASFVKNGQINHLYWIK